MIIEECKGMPFCKPQQLHTKSCFAIEKYYCISFIKCLQWQYKKVRKVFLTFWKDRRKNVIDICTFTRNSMKLIAEGFFGDKTPNKNNFFFTTDGYVKSIRTDATCLFSCGLKVKLQNY